MGYDMFTVRRPEGEAERLAAAQAVVDAAIEACQEHVRDSPQYKAARAKVTEAYGALSEARTSYFRLNGAGMSCWCDAMSSLAMLTDDEAPPFPLLEAYGLTEWPEDPSAYAGDERNAVAQKLTDGERRFLAAVRAVIDYEPQPITGIPWEKFSTNDGWLVTPGQIEAALATYRGWDSEGIKVALSEAGIEDTDLWTRWIDYLTRARELGGFRVR